MTMIKRRRFLEIAASVPLVGLSQRALAAAPMARWRGVALGASSQIVLSGISAAEAAPIFAQVRDEIARLEHIFSLYQSQSQISRLNSAQGLNAPAPELLEVLSLSKAVWEASQGAFDPTIQPEWQARAMGQDLPDKTGDFGDIAFSTRSVRLASGGAITLNGVAQGYITDRVADMLRAQGLTDLVVDAGEQRAMGQRPQGGPWRVGVAGPKRDVLAWVTLQNRAMATSSPMGTLVHDDSHIMDARSGQPARLWNTVSLSHDKAAVADALSTAACCLTAPEMDQMMAAFPGANVIYRA